MPSFAFEPSTFTLPPTTAVGSRPAAFSTVATIDVVVVFPCEPAIATEYFRRINSASISARGMTGIFRRRAATTSGLSFFTADEMTTTSEVCRFSSRCPKPMRAPSVTRRRVTSDSFRSLPETWYPRLSSTSAMPDMPMPPMPTKCTRAAWRDLKRLPMGA